MIFSLRVISTSCSLPIFRPGSTMVQVQVSRAARMCNGCMPVRAVCKPHSPDLKRGALATDARGCSLQVLQTAVWRMGRGDTWGGATLGAGRHVSLHPPPIPLVYTANLIGVDLSMCIPLCKILSNWFGHITEILCAKSRIIRLS